MSVPIILTIAVVLSGGLGWLVIRTNSITRDGDWHSYEPSAYKLRRWHNGKWEYKDMTPEEARQHQLDNAL